MKAVPSLMNPEGISVIFSKPSAMLYILYDRWISEVLVQKLFRCPIQREAFGAGRAVANTIRVLPERGG